MVLLKSDSVIVEKKLSWRESGAWITPFMGQGEEEMARAMEDGEDTSPWMRVVEMGREERKEVVEGVGGERERKVRLWAPWVAIPLVAY